jgi:hypothetical protein
MSAKKATSMAPAAKLALYEKLVATDPTVERKGATMPYTSIAGKMFSFLSPTGQLALRLPDEEREAFLKKHKAKLAKSHDTVLKDWVAVPDALFARTAALAPYLRISREYAKRLGTKGSLARAVTGAAKRAGAGRPRKASPRPR